MGYRHIMISELTAVGEEDLPTWFTDKYKGMIDFNGSYWRTKTEYKRYGILGGIEQDIQTLLRKGVLGRKDEFQLVFFADEGLLCRNSADVSHVLITIDEIIETFVGE